MHSWSLSARTEWKGTIEPLVLCSICMLMNTSDFAQLRKDRI